MTQAGQVGQYSNKIPPGDTARVTVMMDSIEIGTVDGVADLDGQWQTGRSTFSGTYPPSRRAGPRPACRWSTTSADGPNQPAPR